MPRRFLVSAAAAVAASAPAPAQARPVTVNLRVEGPTATIFEGRVTTDVRPFRFTNDPTPHECDGTAATGGSSPVPVPVRNGALATAAEQHHFALTGTWTEGLGASFNRVGDQRVAFDPVTNRYLVEYKNSVVTQLGGCADPIADGDDVLYAYGTGNEPLLALSAPAKAAPGRRVTVTVTTTTGARVAGASVGGARTGPRGRARVLVPATSGPIVLKAGKPGTIRSNAATVCVTTGRDGVTCPAVDRRAPRGAIRSVRDGRRFARGRGPRVLAGTVARDASGIRDVSLRLTRVAGGRCRAYDGRRRRLVATRCGGGRFFSVGAGRAWRYVLPARLPRGRWVLDVRVTDGAGNVERRRDRGRTRVVFVVG